MWSRVPASYGEPRHGIHLDGRAVAAQSRPATTLELSMDTSRRDFLRVAMATGGAAALGFRTSVATAGTHTARSRESGRSSVGNGAKLRILILGGTGFIGPYQVQYALARGH